MRFPRRLSPSLRPLPSGLPTATAVVVALMVAMASTLADTGGGAIDSREAVPGRVSQSLLLSGRVLATALTSVAEQLEEDWTERHRPANRPFTGKGAWPTNQTHLGFLSGRTPEMASCASASARRELSSVAALDPARHAMHRRMLNLPPPRA